jgi:hypothetical protein
VPAKLVYESRAKRWRSLVLLVAVVAFCIAVGAGWLGAPVGRRAELGVAAVVLVALGVPAIWRQLREPQPILLLDGEGIEGSFGFVPWSAVKTFQLQRRRSVRFSLETGGHPARKPRHEYTAMGASAADDVLEIPFWASRSEVVDDLRMYLPAVALDALDD